MMTWKKRVLSGVMALSLVSVMAMQYTSNVLALENAEVDYLDEVMGKYLSGTDYASMDDVKLSAGINYYNFSTMQVCGKVYIAYCGNDVIGMLNVGLEDGERYSSFNRCSFPAIQEAYDAGKSVALGCYDGQILLYDGEKFYNTMTSPVETVELSAVDVPLSALDCVYDDFDPYVRIARSMIMGRTMFDVDAVPNNSINGGICWAASVAAKYKYENTYIFNSDGSFEENEVNITALNVYYRVRKVTGLAAPAGTVENTRIALREYGLLDSYKDGGMSATKVYAEVENNNPIIITIANKTACHSVIIYGVEYYDFDTAKYYISDCNFAGTDIEYELTAEVRSNAASNWKDFNYYQSAYGMAFTDWTQTFSYKFD